MHAVFDKNKALNLCKEDKELIEDIARHITGIKSNVDAMVEERKKANVLKEAREKAIAYHDNVEKYFDVIRYHVDRLERVVDNEIWPLPKYRELLFIS